jgi:hypothetical protein
MSWVKKWPNADFIRYMTFGNSEALLVTSLVAQKEFLQAKCYSFVKPPFFKRLIVDIAGLGIIFSEGDDHKSQRKALRGKTAAFWTERRVADNTLGIGMFSLGNLKSFLPVFRSKAEELSGLFDRAIAKDGGTVDCE